MIIDLAMIYEFFICVKAFDETIIEMTKKCFLFC